MNTITETNDQDTAARIIIEALDANKMAIVSYTNTGDNNDDMTYYNTYRCNAYAMALENGENAPVETNDGELWEGRDLGDVLSFTVPAKARIYVFPDHGQTVRTEGDGFRVTAQRAVWREPKSKTKTKQEDVFDPPFSWRGMRQKT